MRQNCLVLGSFMAINFVGETTNKIFSAITCVIETYIGIFQLLASVIVQAKAGALSNQSDMTESPKILKSMVIVAARNNGRDRPSMLSLVL